MEIRRARRGTQRSDLVGLADESEGWLQGSSVKGSAERSRGVAVHLPGMNSGDRGGQQSSAGLLGPAEPGTSRYAVGLAIPRPVACLQSRSPLHQAKEYSLRVQAGQNRQGRFERNDGFVALKTGPGRSSLSPGVHSCHRRKEGSSRYQASTDRQWAKTDSGASVSSRPTRIEGRRRHRKQRTCDPSQ